MDTRRIEQDLQAVGCVGVGFVSGDQAQFGDWLTPWLQAGHQAGMAWMADHGAIRQNPLSIEPWGKSFICLAFPYKTAPPVGWERHNPISRYAWGKDYHEVIKKRLKTLVQQWQRDLGPFQARVLVDSAPLPEKLLALRAGLGFLGRNSLLITPSHGSYVFLAEILTDLDLPTSAPYAGPSCGSCRACLEACPGNAIGPPGVVNANRCISYLTIEKKGEFSEGETKIPRFQLFGCDLCQECCPYNQQAPLQENSPFGCFDRWQGLTPDQVLAWSEQDWETLKQTSPLKRAGLAGLRRNAAALVQREH